MNRYRRVIPRGGVTGYVVARPADPTPTPRDQRRAPAVQLRIRERTADPANDAWWVMRYAAKTPRAALTWARVHRPDLVATFGDAVLLASAGRGGCRWCRASLTASVRSTAAPDRLTRPLLDLLGRPCDACTVRLANATAERADARLADRVASGVPGTYSCASGCCEVEVVGRIHDEADNCTCDVPGVEHVAASATTYPRRYAVPPGSRVLREYEDRGDGVRRWTGRTVPLPRRRATPATLAASIAAARVPQPTRPDVAGSGHRTPPRPTAYGRDGRPVAWAGCGTTDPDLIAFYDRHTAGR